MARSEAAAGTMPVFVVDAHCDLPLNLMEGDARLAEQSPLTGEENKCRGLYSIPQWRAGGVKLQVCAVYSGYHDLEMNIPRPEIQTVTLHQALAMVAAFHHQADANSADVKVIERVADLEEIQGDDRIGLLLGMEGAEPLGADLRLLSLFFRLGLRTMSLTWNARNLFADGARAAPKHAGGLTELGFELVEEAQQRGILLDVAHLHPVGFWDLMEVARRPIVHTHTRISPRFTEDQARAIANTGGVVCVIFYGMKDASEIADALEQIVNVVGEDHAGIGSDLWGWSAAPADVQHIGELPNLVRELRTRGHSERIIDKMLGSNMLRVFRETLPA